MFNLGVGDTNPPFLKKIIKMEKIKKIIYFFVLIVFYFVWTFDRALHVILPHREHDTFKIWIKDHWTVGNSFLRLLTFVFLYGVYGLINFLVG